MIDDREEKKEKRPVVKRAYLERQCEIIESLISDGYANITIADIFRRGKIDSAEMGPNQIVGITKDLQAALGRKIRNMLEDRNPTVRILPMSDKFFKIFPGKDGPNDSAVAHRIQRDYAMMKENRPDDKETWESFAKRRLRICVAGAHTAQGIRVIQGQVIDPFFVAYEESRSGTAQRNWQNILSEMSQNVAEGRLSQADADRMLHGGKVLAIGRQK